MSDKYLYDFSHTSEEWADQFLNDSSYPVKQELEELGVTVTDMAKHNESESSNSTQLPSEGVAGVEHVPTEETGTSLTVGEAQSSSRQTQRRQVGDPRPRAGIEGDGAQNAPRSSHRRNRGWAHKYLDVNNYDDMATQVKKRRRGSSNESEDDEVNEPDRKRVTRCRAAVEGDGENEFKSKLHPSKREGGNTKQTMDIAGGTETDKQGKQKERAVRTTQATVRAFLPAIVIDGLVDSGNRPVIACPRGNMKFSGLVEMTKYQCLNIYKRNFFSVDAQYHLEAPHSDCQSPLFWVGSGQPRRVLELGVEVTAHQQDLNGVDVGLERFTDATRTAKDGYLAISWQEPSVPATMAQLERENDYFRPYLRPRNPTSGMWERASFHKATEHNGSRRKEQDFDVLVISVLAKLSPTEIVVVGKCSSEQFIVTARSPAGIGPKAAAKEAARKAEARKAEVGVSRKQPKRKAVGERSYAESIDDEGIEDDSADEQAPRKSNSGPSKRRRVGSRLGQNQRDNFDQQKQPAARAPPPLIQPRSYQAPPIMANMPLSQQFDPSQYVQSPIYAMTPAPVTSNISGHAPPSEVGQRNDSGDGSWHPRGMNYVGRGPNQSHLGQFQTAPHMYPSGAPHNMAQVPAVQHQEHLVSQYVQQPISAYGQQYPRQSASTPTSNFGAQRTSNEMRQRQLRKQRESVRALQSSLSVTESMRPSTQIGRPEPSPATTNDSSASEQLFETFNDHAIQQDLHGGPARVANFGRASAEADMTPCPPLQRADAFLQYGNQQGLGTRADFMAHPMEPNHSTLAHDQTLGMPDGWDDASQLVGEQHGLSMVAARARHLRNGLSVTQVMWGDTSATGLQYDFMQPGNERTGSIIPSPADRPGPNETTSALMLSGSNSTIESEEQQPTVYHTSLNADLDNDAEFDFGGVNIQQNGNGQDASDRDLSVAMLEYADEPDNLPADYLVSLPNHDPYCEQ